jgi:hypothetical protein
MHAIVMLRFIGSQFTNVVELWVEAFMTMTLGLLLGFDLVKNILTEPDMGHGFPAKLEQLYETLRSYRNKLGVAGIAVGILCL